MFGKLDPSSFQGKKCKPKVFCWKIFLNKMVVEDVDWKVENIQSIVLRNWFRILKTVQIKGNFWHFPMHSFLIEKRNKWIFFQIFCSGWKVDFHTCSKNATFTFGNKWVRFSRKCKVNRAFDISDPPQFQCMDFDWNFFKHHQPAVSYQWLS